MNVNGSSGKRGDLRGGVLRRSYHVGRDMVSRQALTRRSPDHPPPPLRLRLPTFDEAAAHAMATQDQIHDPGTTNNAGNAGHCAMRGSCGPKDWASKPLPCPYNEPASDVREIPLLRGVL